MLPVELRQAEVVQGGEPVMESLAAHRRGPGRCRCMRPRRVRVGVEEGVEQGQRDAVGIEHGGHVQDAGGQRRSVGGGGDRGGPGGGHGLLVERLGLGVEQLRGREFVQQVEVGGEVRSSPVGAAVRGGVLQRQREPAQRQREPLGGGAFGVGASGLTK